MLDMPQEQSPKGKWGKVAKKHQNIKKLQKNLVINPSVASSYTLRCQQGSLQHFMFQSFHWNSSPCFFSWKPQFPPQPRRGAQPSSQTPILLSNKAVYHSSCTARKLQLHEIQWLLCLKLTEILHLLRILSCHEFLDYMWSTTSTFLQQKQL